ncbi:glycosyltransferase family protein [Anabaena subtropica]|uniref:Glycosyl transferase n=1 Tax=Anabaena subtropica FACHB-260 TaxID=2692884 RepID=A0ABR8CQV3_9NOST|nr:glycosyltransferase [Anabaena subtropica]MBD2344562.1 glycosyl transferase [Anabaena subtropica FACHB-260]
MKKIMFYCQYLSGMGHLVRSTEIVRNLVKYFQVYFIVGGPKIVGFEMPAQVKLIQLPALWLENGRFIVEDDYNSVEEVKELRKNLLISEFDKTKPDYLITEFFPFGRHKLLFELVPLVEHIKTTSPDTKILCSLRDVIGKDSNQEEEETICYLMNRYFDLLLFHADARFQQFSETFPRYKDIKAEIIHTGFVTQPVMKNIDDHQLWGEVNPGIKKILVSVGGGRIGYELLKTVIEASPILARQIPCIIKIFTGPFMPEEKVDQLTQLTAHQENIHIETYTLQLLAYMQTADISLSLSGYNTTINILSTGVRAIVVPIGHENEDKEQLIRTQKLQQLGILDYMFAQDLEAYNLADRIITCLNKNRAWESYPQFDLQGAEKTAVFLKNLSHGEEDTCAGGFPELSKVSVTHKRGGV